MLSACAGRTRPRMLKVTVLVIKILYRFGKPASFPVSLCTILGIVCRRNSTEIEKKCVCNKKFLPSGFECVCGPEFYFDGTTCLCKPNST